MDQFLHLLQVLTLRPSRRSYLYTPATWWIRLSLTHNLSSSRNRSHPAERTSPLTRNPPWQPLKVGTNKLLNWTVVTIIFCSAGPVVKWHLFSAHLHKLLNFTTCYCVVFAYFSHFYILKTTEPLSINVVVIFYHWNSFSKPWTALLLRTASRVSNVTIEPVVVSARHIKIYLQEYVLWKFLCKVFDPPHFSVEGIRTTSFGYWRCMQLTQFFYFYTIVVIVYNLHYLFIYRACHQNSSSQQWRERFHWSGAGQGKFVVWETVKCVLSGAGSTKGTHI